MLAGRDLRVRYKQTVLGVAWVVLQPLVAAAIFTIVLGRLAGVPSDGLPYAVFVYSGLVIWTYFASGLEGVSQSLVRDRDLVTRTYFPRILAPGAGTIPGLVDLAVSLVVLGVMMVAYEVSPGAELLLLPFWVLAAMLVLLGAGLWLSALNVRYRDVRHTLTFLVQVWFFASPVVYPARSSEGSWTYVYALNPMVTVIDGFRWSAGRGTSPGCARPRVAGRHRRPLRLGRRLLPARGAQVRGRDLMGAAIIADGLGKRYRLGGGQYTRTVTLRETVARRLRGRAIEAPRADEIWALRDVNLEIERATASGSSVGTAPGRRRS